jgi:hypothetical protein
MELVVNQNNEFFELEYKYLADDIKLSDFTSLMDKIKTKYELKKFLQASSFDVYYTKKDNPDEFQRFRNDGKTPELTKKVKIKTSNNWERVESDLPLDPLRISEEKVSFHLSLDNYSYNFRIFKVCFIYFYEDVNYVWYSVYDYDMKEMDRFIEVELNKDKVTRTEKDILTLKEHESNLLELGITSQNRTRLSLFERYRK